MILKPVQFLYEFGSNLKNKFYDSTFLKKVKIPVPVISVGNLSVGGTGKTPCVQMLAESFLAQTKYKKITIVSRSYKGQLKGPRKVELSMTNAAAVFGDEPCLLQKLLPGCSVWAGPNKSVTAQAAYASEKPDLIIVDDGFSHRRLMRDFDLVLIDATVPLSYYQTLPVGRLREPLKQITRAHAVLITRANLVDDKKIEKIKDLLLEANSTLKKSIYLANSMTNIADIASASELLVFCGLGNPKSFKASLEKLGHTVVIFKEFADHYLYKTTDLDKLYELHRASPNLKVVTTEKDLIKISNHPLLNVIHPAKNSLEIVDQRKGDLIEKIRGYL